MPRKKIIFAIFLTTLFLLCVQHNSYNTTPNTTLPANSFKDVLTYTNVSSLNVTHSKLLRDILESGGWIIAANLSDPSSRTLGFLNIYAHRFDHRNLYCMNLFQLGEDNTLCAELKKKFGEFFLIYKENGTIYVVKNKTKAINVIELRNPELLKSPNVTLPNPKSYIFGNTTKILLTKLRSMRAKVLIYNPYSNDFWNAYPTLKRVLAITYAKLQSNNYTRLLIPCSIDYVKYDVPTLSALYEVHDKIPKNISLLLIDFDGNSTYVYTDPRTIVEYLESYIEANVT